MYKKNQIKKEKKKERIKRTIDTKAKKTPKIWKHLKFVLSICLQQGLIVYISMLNDIVYVFFEEHGRDNGLEISELSYTLGLKYMYFC